MNDQLTLWDVPQMGKPTRVPLTVRKPLTNQEQMFEWAKAHCFPQFAFSLGGPWIGTVQAGEANWQEFCERVDVYVIQLALQSRSQAV